MTEKEIWVYGDLRNERFFEYSLKILSKAHELAQTISGKTAMILLGSSDHNTNTKEILPGFSSLSVDNAADKSIEHGADKVYIIDHPDFKDLNAYIFAKALANISDLRSPTLIMFSLTDLGREMASHAARLKNAGLIADCIDLKIVKDQIIASCPSWGGEIMAEITFSNPSKTGFATVQPHAFKTIKTKGVPGTIEKIPVTFQDTKQKIRLISRSLNPLEHRKIEDAKTVVVGGAGMGNANNFGLVRNLASSLEGEVAATRPPVLLHWIEEDRLIGQTGKTIRPDLLFSIGTSGAIQYTAGIMEAKTIVAINRDPESPIFQVADIGIIADAKILLPILINKVKQIAMRNFADILCNKGDIKTKETFGVKIRKIREANNWSVETLAQDTGMSPEFINQVENDTIIPSVSFILRLARALKVDPSTFLQEEEKVAIRDQRIEAFSRRTNNYSYQTLTPGAEKEHLRAFLVTIESKQSHKPVAYKHEGEEFIFVMSGDLELTLENKINHLKTGESVHFNSEVPHKLKSLSDDATQCLVILYTP